MNRLQAGLRLCFYALAIVALPTRAATFDGLFNDDQKSWAEIETQLPPFPEAENLIPFTVGAVRDKRYFVDANSLSVGSDGVLRYTLIIISAGGAQNISHEGLRCDTAERRFYAFGRSDKSWSKPRGSQWVRIEGSTNNPYVELFGNYFCPVGERSITSAEDARRALRYGGQPGVTRR